MPYCPKCGTMADGSFCPACGSAIGAAAPGPGAAPPPVAGVGLTDNVAGALCYVLGILTGILFLVLAPYNQNPRVKFHAWQSILFNVAWIAFWILLSIVTGMLHFFALLLLPIEALIGLGGFFLWLFLMWKAYNNELFEIPIIGPFARQQAGF
jgi:uncharacterized membrane protein